MGVLQLVQGEGGGGGSESEKVAAAETKGLGGPSGLRPLAPAWAMATSPAWPLPAEGARGLRINQLSQEAKQDAPGAELGMLPWAGDLRQSPEGSFRIHPPGERGQQGARLN